MPQITKMDVSFVSLVKSPANRKELVMKSESQATFNVTKQIKVTKATDQGLIYGTVYPLDDPDTDGDFANLETVRKAAHDFLLKGRQFNVDKDHDFTPTGGAIVESWVDEKKGWQVAIKLDPESDVFKSAKAGNYQGLSMAAQVVRKEADPPKKEDPKTTNNDEIIKRQEAVEATIKKHSEVLEQVLKALKTVNKSKQLVVDGDNVVVKDADTLSEFSFKE